MGKMEQQLIHILRDYELRLLRCTLTPPSSSSSSSSQRKPPPQQHLLCDSTTQNLVSEIDKVISFIETGNYLHPLSSLPLPYVDVAHYLNSAKDNETKASTLMLLFCVAVSSFFSFIHTNFTGPTLTLPQFPFSLKHSQAEDDITDWETWANNHILSHASHLLAKFSNLQYLVFAKHLLMEAKDWLFHSELASLYGFRTITWWFSRILLIHQRILDELSSSLFDLLQVSTAETLNRFGSLENITAYWGTSLHDGEASDFVSMLHLESGIMEYVYGRLDSCRLHFETAEAAAGHELSISGAFGFRTIHQTEPKQQLVLVSNKSSSGSDVNTPLTSSGTVEHDHTVVENNLDQYNVISDVLMTPKLLGNGTESETNQPSIGNSPGYSVPLKPLQQATVLASCLLVEKSSRHDEAQRWDMAPFIEAIDSQSSSYFILKCFCNISRIRWESTRSHTKARALEMMDNLVEGVDKPCPEVPHRIPLFFAVYMPSISSLKKEYGELLVSCGIVGEAIKIFEDLELWDNLIYCTCLLGKKAEAVELIRKRLSEMPNDPKLWCMLGDATNNDSYYQKALEVSKNRSARAKRSLARSAYNRGHYEESKLLWESAMALNSLYKDGWFALGAAALKARDVDKALEGFSRAVKLDPENGEAWNNIACLHMVKKKSKEAFIAFKEALKFKRDSWQMWENYSHVAMDVGNIFQALEAIQMVFRLSGGKKTGAELLEPVVREMEQTVSEESQLGVERSRETEQLLEFLGKVLHQIVSNGNGGNIWGLYARWHKIRGDLMLCSEALLKQVRSYQGLELWKDEDRFKKYAEASLELCKVYMEISSSTGSRRELSSAQMHLRNIIKQGESFRNSQEYKDVEALYLQVQMTIQSLTS